MVLRREGTVQLNKKRINTLEKGGNRATEKKNRKKLMEWEVTKQLKENEIKSPSKGR